jgi:hypothetical protein
MRSPKCSRPGTSRIPHLICSGRRFIHRLTGQNPLSRHRRTLRFPFPQPTKKPSIACALPYVSFAACALLAASSFSSSSADQGGTMIPGGSPCFLRCSSRSSASKNTSSGSLSHTSHFLWMRGQWVARSCSKSLASVVTSKPACAPRRQSTGPRLSTGVLCLCWS